MSQYPATSPGGYPPNAGGYPPNSGGYPQTTGGYPPNTGGYPPNAGAYPQTTGGYPQNTGGYPRNENLGGQNTYLPYPTGQDGTGLSPSHSIPPGSFTPNQPPPGGFTPNQPPPGGFSPNQQMPSGGFPSPAGGFTPNQPPPGGFPPGANLPPAGPGAPPLHELADLPGYEGITFDDSALKPPPYDPSTMRPSEARQSFQNAPSLTEEQVKEALVQYVSEHCCYGSRPAKEMNVKDITFNSAIHYQLETYGEKRETAWAFEPFKPGQSSTMQMGGYAPGPWEITVASDTGEFCHCKKSLEVPNTTNLRPCHKCVALGRCRCSKCEGRGGKQCTWCHGSGRRKKFEEMEQCSSCAGTGFDRCSHCHGEGQMTCDICKGHCQLRYYIKMTVTWNSHIEDHISDCAAMPKDLIRGVSGDLAFKEQQPRVWPISNFPDATVNTASHRLVEKHSTAFPDERILQQRHVVRIVPIAQVEYDWRNKSGSFYVYGFENKVYFPDYPQSCCCGCQIM